MDTTRNDKKSLLMIISAMLIYGTIGIFRRYIPLSSAVLACCRGVIGSLFLLCIIKLSGKKFWNQISSMQLLGLIFTGAMIGVNWLLLFEAYNYTSVATATLCYYMQPTILILISPVFFKERITVKKIVCAMTAIIGMIFVSGVVESGLPAAGELRGILCGLGAATLYAAVIVMNKKLSGIDAYQKTIVELFFAAVVMLPSILVTNDVKGAEFDLKAVVMLAIVGLVHTGIAYALYFGSMDGLRTQSIALLSYIDPVTALLLSSIILHEHLTMFGVIGAIMILTAAIFGEYSNE